MEKSGVITRIMPQPGRSECLVSVWLEDGRLYTGYQYGLGQLAREMDRSLETLVGCSCSFDDGFWQFVRVEGPFPAG